MAIDKEERSGGTVDCSFMLCTLDTKVMGIAKAVCACKDVLIKLVVLIFGGQSKSMAIRIVEFSNGGYKIRKVFV